MINKADMFGMKSVSQLKADSEEELKLQAKEVLEKAIQENKIVYYEATELQPYHAHFFPPLEGEEFLDLVGSIRTFGVIQPVIIRMYQGHPEIIAGHNRTRACEAANIKVPTIMIEADDVLADLIVNETNIYQRTFSALPVSLQAKILQIQIDNLRKTERRRELVYNVDNDTGPEPSYSRDVVGAQYGMNGRTVSRKLQINNLVDDLKERLDQGKIPLTAAYALADLSEDLQSYVSLYLDDGYKINKKKAELLRVEALDGKLTPEKIEEIFSGVEPVEYIPFPHCQTDNEVLRLLMSFDVYWQPWFVCKQTGETYYKWPISEQVTLAARRFSSLSDGTEDFEYFLLEDNKPFRACDIEVLDLIDRLMQL